MKKIDAKEHIRQFYDNFERVTGEPYSRHFCANARDYRSVAEFVAVRLSYWAADNEVTVREQEWRFQQHLRKARCELDQPKFEVTTPLRGNGVRLRRTD